MTTVEPQFADNFGTDIKFPDYIGVLISGVFSTMFPHRQEELKYDIILTLIII